MKLRHAIAVAAVFLLVSGLTGCRSSKARAAAPQGQQYVAVQPPPQSMPRTTYAPPPTTTTWTGPSRVVVQAPQVPQAPPAPMPMGPTGSGSPDGFGPAPSPTSGTYADVIQGERQAQQDLDRRFREFEDRLARIGQDAPASTANVAPALPTGAGEDQATRFAELIASKTTGEVERNGTAVVIRFSNAFLPGSEQLRTDPKVTSTLLAAADELSRTPGARIEVVGHSDGSPLKKTRNKWRDNVHLSQERAQTVANRLSTNGVAAGRIAVNGRGSVEPLVFPEKSDSDRARNRRVEIHVIF